MSDAHVPRNASTQLAAANENAIKFYDFIDKTSQEANKKQVQNKEELQKQMKDLFIELDKENNLKLKKADIRTYISNLASKIGEEQFIAADKCSQDAFDAY